MIGVNLLLPAAARAMPIGIVDVSVEPFKQKQESITAQQS